MYEYRQMLPCYVRITSGAENSYSIFEGAPPEQDDRIYKLNSTPIR